METMPKIIITKSEDRLRLMQQFGSLSRGYMYHSLAFERNSLRASSIRSWAMNNLESARVVED